MVRYALPKAENNKVQTTKQKTFLLSYFNVVAKLFYASWLAVFT